MFHFPDGALPGLYFQYLNVQCCFYILQGPADIELTLVVSC